MEIGLSLTPVHPWRSLAANGPFSNHATLANDLVSSWELSVDGTDSHGTNDLTNNNSVTFVAKGEGAPANMPATVANIVAASSQYLGVADNSTFNFASTGFTLAFWVKSAGGNMVVSKDDGGANRAWVYVNSWYVFQNDSAFSQAGSLTVPDAAWHFFLLWFDPAVLKAEGSRNNGATQQGGAIASMQDQAVAFEIGRFTTSFSNGLHGPVMLWSRVLTSDERTDLYNAGAGLFY